MTRVVRSGVSGLVDVSVASGAGEVAGPASDGDVIPDNVWVGPPPGDDDKLSGSSIEGRPWWRTWDWMFIVGGRR